MNDVYIIVRIISILEWVCCFNLFISGIKSVAGMCRTVYGNRYGAFLLRVLESLNSQFMDLNL